MKKLLLLVAFLFATATIYAQVPNFASVAGNRKLYGYTSFKFRPGINSQETYTTLQYGIGDSFAAGMDLATGLGSAYIGVTVRYGAKISPYFNLGLQLTPSFDLNNSARYSYTTEALYLTGNITRDGRLFYVSDTWFGLNRDSANTYTQWTYLAYTIQFKNGHSITPMIGEIHSWKFDDRAYLAAGFYYSIKTWSFYVWGNDFFKKNPRIVFGIEFKL